VDTIRITDPLTGLPIAEFEGEQIGFADSKGDRDPDRWVELTAWKLPGPSGPTWMFGKNGRSKIYHTEHTRCKGVDGQAGSAAMIDDLPDDAVPCPVCRPLPPEQLADEADAGHVVAIRYEFDRVEVTPCQTADYLITFAATKRDRTRHNVSVMLSGPARQLVAECMTDPDFRAQVQASLPASARRPVA